MTFLEATVLITRWAHVIATVTWVGGNIFFLTVLRPAIRQSGGSPELLRSIGGGFKQAVDLSMWVLIITGAILIYDRLTQEIAIPFAVVLGVKIALSAAMFLIAISLGRRGAQRRSLPLDGAWSEILPVPLARLFANVRASWGRIASPTNILFVVGPAVIFLGLLLRFIGG